MEGGFAGFDSKQERLHETYAIVQSLQGQQRITLVKGRQRYFFLLQSVTLLGKENREAGPMTDDRRDCGFGKGRIKENFWIAA